MSSSICLFVLCLANTLVRTSNYLLLGDQPSMIDYMLWSFFERLPILYDLSAEIHPNLSNWCGKMHCVPAVKKESLPADVYKRFYDSYFKGHPEYDFS